MALKATIYKAHLQIADLDRHLYADHSLTVARHPSETDERMMIRLLAFALNVPSDERDGALLLAKGLSDVDEPDLWQKNLRGEIEHWIDVGQPDDKRLMKACSRSSAVSVYSYSHSTSVWWQSMASKLSRAKGLSIWQIAPDQSQALAAMSQRSMQLQVTVQEGSIRVGNEKDSIEVQLMQLFSTKAQR